MKRIAFILVAILILLMGIVVVACGGGKEATMPTPPLVTPRDAANITTAEAMLNGNLDDLGTAPSVNVSVVWGTTSGGPYPNETTPQAMNAPGAYSFDLIGHSLFYLLCFFLAETKAKHSIYPGPQAL